MWFRSEKFLRKAIWKPWFSKSEQKQWVKYLYPKTYAHGPCKIDSVYIYIYIYTYIYKYLESTIYTHIIWSYWTVNDTCHKVDHAITLLPA